MKKNSKIARTAKANVVKEAPAKYAAQKPAQKPAAPAQKSSPVPPAPKAPMTKEAMAARAEEKKAEAAKKAVEAVALAKAVKDAPAKPAKAEKAAAAKEPKQPKEKPFTKSMVEVDASAYKQAHDKLPGTGKREPKTVWKFLIGKVPFEMETEFFRTARLAAVERAVSLRETKVAVLA